MMTVMDFELNLLLESELYALTLGKVYSREEYDFWSCILLYLWPEKN